MKYGFFLSLFLIPSVVGATGGAEVSTLENYSGVFASLSLWSTMIIAFVTTVMVWLGGRHMRGGILGSVLNYFSIGMTLLFAAFLAGTPFLSQFLDASYATIIQNILYTAGYILMGIAANKLLLVIKA